MAEAAEFLERTGKVVQVQEFRKLGKDPKYQVEVGGFTIETSKEWKDKKSGEMKTFHDFLTFDCKGNVISQMQDLQAGDTVKVEFTIGGVAWKDKYFNKLKAYKVETTSFVQKSRGEAPPPKKEDIDFLDDNQPEDDSDSLPF
jgi:hypothetical protein